MKIGDIVKIIDRGEIYSTYSEFYQLHKTEACFPYRDGFPGELSNGTEGVLMKIVRHPYEKRRICLVNLNSGDRCILISTTGIMTAEPKPEVTT